MKDGLGLRVAVAASIVLLWLLLGPPDKPTSLPAGPEMTEMVELRDVETDSLIYRGTSSGLDSLLRAKPDLLEPRAPRSILGGMR